MARRKMNFQLEWPHHAILFFYLAISGVKISFKNSYYKIRKNSYLSDYNAPSTILLYHCEIWPVRMKDIRKLSLTGVNIPAKWTEFHMIAHLRTYLSTVKSYQWLEKASLKGNIEAMIILAQKQDSSK